MCKEGLIKCWLHSIHICFVIPTNTGKKQKSSSSSLPNSSHSLPNIHKKACQIAFVRMFVAMELLFWLVEHEAFWEFLSIVVPFLVAISHTTLARDVLKLLSSEKERMKNFFSYATIGFVSLWTHGLHQKIKVIWVW